MSVAAASSVVSRLVGIEREGVAVERLGRRQVEKGMRQHPQQRRLIDPPARRHVAVAVDRRAGALEHEIVDQRIAGSGVAGDRLLAVVDIGDICHAADIQQRHLALHPARDDQRAVEHRHDRSALTAGGDVGGAEIESDVDAEPVGERLSVADLNGEFLLGLVQHGLAVEADDVDAAGLHPIVAQKCLDGFGMAVGDHALGEGENARPRVAILERRRFGERIAQEGAVGVVIGVIAGRPEGDGRLPVGLDQSDVDAVHGGAGHEADGAMKRQGESPEAD